jgi:hypothetical protein
MALLLVLAVLACHGALGAAFHQPSETEAGVAASGTPLLADGGSSQTAHAGDDANAPGHAASDLLTNWADGGSAADTASVLSHAGALLFVLSATFLPWLAGTTWRRGASPPRLPLWRVYPTRAVALASRPVIPTLRVFRL